MNARIILFLMAIWTCLGCEAAPTPAATPDAASDTAAPKDVAADVPADVPADVLADVAADVAADVPADIAADIAADVPADIAADIAADVPTDVPADVPTDIAADVPADVPAAVVIGPCDPSGGLAVPTTKRAKMVATFDQPANGYNGPLEAFDGTSDDTSTMSKFVYASIVSWLASEVKGMDDSRSVSITFDMQKPAACAVYNLTSAKAGNNHLTWSHKGKAWRCDGSVMIDTINGKAYQFHFDGQCIGDPESSPPGVGSVHMVGKGSALM